MTGNALWRRVAEDIAAKIRDGSYPVGSRIPKYDALAAHYDVSVGTARKAVDVLRAHSTLEGESGVGIYVRAQPPDNLDPPDRLAALEARVAELERWRAEKERGE